MSRRAGGRGFTLLELMVAIGIGAIVVTGLAMLAAGSTRAFHEEHRIAETQLELRFAAERLRADIQRAGYLATANSATDPDISPRPAPALVGVLLEDADGDVWLPAKNERIEPDRLRLLGAYRDSEVYLTQGIAGDTVTLDDSTRSAEGWAARQDVFERIFAPSSLMRIENPAGFSQIIGIESADFATLRVTLDRPVTQALGAQPQGVMLLGRGHRVNVIDYIDYRIVASAGGVLGRDESNPARKTDLVRRELMSDGVTPVPGSDRIVAEYAVDFEVAFTVDVAPIGSPPNLADSRFDASAAVANPERIRAIRFRLSTRSREEDPTFPWRERGEDDALLRFKIEPTTLGAARVRTIESTVVVPGLRRR